MDVVNEALEEIVRVHKIKARRENAQKVSALTKRLNTALKRNSALERKVKTLTLEVKKVKADYAAKEKTLKLAAERVVEKYRALDRFLQGTLADRIKPWDRMDTSWGRGRKKALAVRKLLAGSPKKMP
jgi:hypothetical protein